MPELPPSEMSPAALKAVGGEFRPSFTPTGRQKLEEGRGERTYYKRPRKDPLTGERWWEVTSAKWFESEHQKRVNDQGWQHLRQYYSFVGNEQPVDGFGLFTALIQRGGAKEFDPRQIIESGWAHEPVVLTHTCEGATMRPPDYSECRCPPVEFPQMADVELEPKRFCEPCQGSGMARWFTSEAKLKKHTAIMHRDVAADRSMARELGKGIVDALDTGILTRTGPPPAEGGPPIWRCRVAGCPRFFDSKQGEQVHRQQHPKEERGHDD